LLIGTLSVKESEELAERLREEKIDCQVLNARNDESEAAVIARAGRFGAVTISTNMAGRGTDILLGGGDPADREKVIGLGGLYVIGTNRHESLRIDQQLRGRAGRQGDVGMSRFFISFEDELLIKYKFKELLPKRLRKIQSEEAVQNKRIAKFIRITQRIIESRFFDMRKALYEFSNFMEKQRLVLQKEREAILANDGELQERVGVMVKDEGLRLKLRQLILLLYDRYWAIHLDFLTQAREGIYLVQLGGQSPLREFRRMADEHFQEILSALDSEIPAKVSFVFDHPETDLSELGLQRPRSTWTYIVHDNPFGNQLALMLLDNSNIGFTADPISAIALFFYALLQKRNKRNS
jgi:preprotein translocase subunit SecA